MLQNFAKVPEKARRQLRFLHILIYAEESRGNFYIFVSFAEEEEKQGQIQSSVSTLLQFEEFDEKTGEKLVIFVRKDTGFFLFISCKLLQKFNIGACLEYFFYLSCPA